VTTASTHRNSDRSAERSRPRRASDAGPHGTRAATQPWQLSGLDALRAFRSGALSPVELMDSVLSRAASLDDGPTGTANGSKQAINAIVQTLDDARDLARGAADQYARGIDEPLGHGRSTLLGLPVAAKEKHGLSGETLSEGLVANRLALAGENHPVIARIRATGGIVHARTASPEFSCATVTNSPLWGTTRNPWNRSLSPGGSSGGAGAALAAGFTPLATASDIAGSTRIPAAFTGTVGYKAPYGRVPGRTPLSVDWYRGDGPMARTVEDTALLYRVMAGIHPADHTTVPGSGEVPLEFSDAADWLVGRRIGVSWRLGDYAVHPDVMAALRATAARLEAAGAEVVEIELPWTSGRIRDLSMAHFGHLLVPTMRQITVGHNDLGTYTRRFMEDAEAAATRMSFQQTVVAEAEMQSELAEAMADVDVLLCPVSAVDGLRAEGDYLDGIDTIGPDGSRVHLEHYWQGHMTVPFNINNRCPVLATPAGFAENGLPVGVQWVGHPYDEVSVFRAGAAWQQLAPWSGLAPLD
jgi:aspartyl-tRNA(Asn)/glutamyl-tRNA(Gln) amidotransferase subunit A